MQSNYSEFPNVMSVADAKTFATELQAASEYVLMYRGATYITSKQHESGVSQLAKGRSLPANTLLYYRGTSYPIGDVIVNSARSNRVEKQQLIYRGVTYEV